MNTVTRPRNAKGHFMNAAEFAEYQQALAPVESVLEEKLDEVPAEPTREEQLAEAIQGFVARVVKYAETFYGKTSGNAVRKAYRELTGADYSTSYKWGDVHGFN